MSNASIEILNQIAQLVYDKKGFNILAVDVQGLSSITDYILIAEGNVDRHVSSIARAVVDELHEKGEKLIHSEGLKTGDWVVLDFGEVMVHIFSPNLREKYSLERLWQDCKIVNLDIDVSSKVSAN